MEGEVVAANLLEEYNKELNEALEYIVCIWLEVIVADTLPVVSADPAQLTV